MKTDTVHFTFKSVALDTKNAGIVVGDGLHCGDELLGRRVTDHVDAHPLEGVWTIHMHPEAHRHLLRYMGIGELGSRMSVAELEGTPCVDLDPEQLAALRFIDSIGKLEDRYWLGIDPHTSNTPNSNCLVVGERIQSIGMLGVASVMGLENVLVLPNYPFFRTFPKFVSVETENAPGKNPLADPVIWHKHIETMRDLGRAGMRTLGMLVKNDLRYYIKLELNRIVNGQIDPVACRLIDELERIPSPEEFFAPVSGLPKYLRDNIPPGKQVLMGSWGDNNNSLERPELLGIGHHGRPRRECFGSFLLQVDPPEVTRHAD